MVSIGYAANTYKYSVGGEATDWNSLSLNIICLSCSYIYFEMTLHILMYQPSFLWAHYLPFSPHFERVSSKPHVYCNEKPWWPCLKIWKRCNAKVLKHWFKPWPRHGDNTFNRAIIKLTIGENYTDSSITSLKSAWSERTDYVRQTKRGQRNYHTPLSPVSMLLHSSSSFFLSLSFHLWCFLLCSWRVDQSHFFLWLYSLWCLFFKGDGC